jgi:TrmH family RNA methyltransferase
MVTRAELKAVRELAARKGRTQQRRFLVQGPKLVAELLASGWPVHAVYATAETADRMALRDARVLPAHEMDRLGTLSEGNAVVAVVPMPPRSPVAAPGAGELLLALDGVSDPGNLGTLLRVADWFGVSGIICAPGGVDVFNPKCVQASMGSIFRVAVHCEDLPARLDALRAAGARLYLATMEGRDVFSAELQRPAVLVLGSESHGISPAVRALDGEAIAVPRAGRAESLNVAMAATALCMEFMRRR